MGKVINIFEYKKKIESNSALPKEKLLEIESKLLYDDDSYLKEFFR